MRIETKLNFKSYLQLMYILTFRTPVVIFLIFAGLIGIFSGIVSLCGIVILFNNPFTPLILGLAILLFIPISFYIRVKKRFTSSARGQEKIIYEFTEDKIKITGESFTSELTWEKTFKILELKNWILIYQNREGAYYIPKVVFGDAINDFRELVKSKPFIKQNFKK